MRTLKLILLVAIALFAIPAMADIKGKKKAGERKKKIELADTYWRLAEMDGRPILPASDNNDPYIFLKEKGKKVIGFTGCNDLSGEYGTDKHDYLGFEMTYTEKACGNMAIEQYLVNALRLSNRYEINGDHLLVYNDHVLLAVFEAK